MGVTALSAPLPTARTVGRRSERRRDGHLCRSYRHGGGGVLPTAHPALSAALRCVGSVHASRRGGLSDTRYITRERATRAPVSSCCCLQPSCVQLGRRTPPTDGIGATADRPLQSRSTWRCSRFVRIGQPHRLENLVVELPESLRSRGCRQRSVGALLGYAFSHGRFARNGHPSV